MDELNAFFAGGAFVISFVSMGVAWLAFKLSRDGIESSVYTLISEKQKFLHELAISDSPTANSDASLKAGYEGLYNAFEFGCKKYYSESVNRNDFKSLYAREIKRLVIRDRKLFNLLEDETKYKNMRKFAAEIKEKDL